VDRAVVQVQVAVSCRGCDVICENHGIWKSAHNLIFCYPNTFPASLNINIKIGSNMLSISFLLRMALLIAIHNSIIGQTCSAETQVDLLGPFYVSGSKNTTNLAPENDLKDPTKRLEVTGRIYSTRECSTKKYYPMANVTLEAWYAGTPDSSGNYYQTKKYRGQLTTNACGGYSFVQAFPTYYPDRPILHNHIRLSDSKGKELLVTQMYFKGSGAGYYNANTINSVLRGVNRDLQATTIITRDDGSCRVKFNIYLDDTANKKCGKFTAS
jgi:protocatechuate 3,4-dioxygenase beta subunit